ncbi:MAG: hypothetical protein IPH08_14640 [Rhodocyclaceae bacterium]|nr:hypothetical protein [Rhodocyclaceae bacterium]
MRPDRSAQAGFGIIAAIVILVIFAGLSAFIVSMSSSQHVGSALDVQGTNAYLAANAGLEWGKFQTSTASCAASTPLTINSFTVTVTCSVQNTGSAMEAGLGTIYSLTSTACTSSPCPSVAPGATYLERRITAVIER